MSIRASVTIEADPNILALKRMLVENGMWLVWVHNRKITKAVRVPTGVMIDDLLDETEKAKERTVESTA